MDIPEFLFVSVVYDVKACFPERVWDPGREDGGRRRYIFKDGLAFSPK